MSTISKAFRKSGDAGVLAPDHNITVTLDNQIFEAPDDYGKRKRGFLSMWTYRNQDQLSAFRDYEVKDGQTVRWECPEDFTFLVADPTGWLDPSTNAAPAWKYSCFYEQYALAAVGKALKLKAGSNGPTKLEYAIVLGCLPLVEKPEHCPVHIPALRRKPQAIALLTAERTILSKALVKATIIISITAEAIAKPIKARTSPAPRKRTRRTQK